MPLIRSGKVRALAVTSPDRWPHAARRADHGRSRHARLRRHLLGRLRHAQGHAGGRSSTSCRRRCSEIAAEPAMSSASCDSGAARRRLDAAGDRRLRRARARQVEGSGAAVRREDGLRWPSHRLSAVTLIDIVREQAARAPEACALVSPQGRYTYGELAGRASRAAGALRAAGVRHGDRIGLLIGNRVEWLDLCLAAGAVGAVVVPLSTWSTRQELVFLLQDAQLALLAVSAHFGDRDFESDLVALQGTPGLPAPDRTWLIDRTDGRFVDFAAAVAAAAPLEALPPGESASAGDDALVLYTSGSTSAPKAVPLRHYAFIENAFNIGERQGLTAGDRVLLASPLFWAYGGANAMPATFSHGATLVLMEKFEPGPAMDLIERERCTSIYTLPAMNASLARHPAYRKERLASLRTGLTIGSSDEFMLAVETLGATELCNIYGATETCGNCAVTWHHWPLEKRAHCQGPPLPGQRASASSTRRPVRRAQPGGRARRSARLHHRRLQRRQRRAERQGLHRRRLVPHRRHGPLRRRGQLRLRRPRQRHDQARRHQRLAGRGRGGADAPSVGARGGGRRRAGCGARRAHRRLHRAQGRRGVRRRRADAPLRSRSLEVQAAGPYRALRRAAAHRHRQAAAARAADGRRTCAAPAARAAG